MINHHALIDSVSRKGNDKANGSNNVFPFSYILYRLLNFIEILYELGSIYDHEYGNVTDK